MAHDKVLAKVLDKHGNDTGKGMSIFDIHKDPNLLCESAHVWIYDPAGWILLQQRSKTHPANPGQWDVSVAGHLDFKEGAADAAAREIKEEIGVDAHTKDLEFLIRKYKETFQINTKTQHQQFVNIFLLKLDKDSLSISLEDGEVEALKWMKIDDFEKEVHDRELVKKYVLHGNAYYDFIMNEIKSRISMTNYQIHKAAGVIIKDRKALVEKSKTKEFFLAPGGKIEKGETPKQALVRELKEEFDIDVSEDDLEFLDTFYDKAAGQEHLIMREEVFLVKKWQGEPRANSEVEKIAWIDSNIPADMRLGSTLTEKIIPKLKDQDLID
jgi:mutator protein MutT